MTNKSAALYKFATRIRAELATCEPGERSRLERRLADTLAAMAEPQQAAPPVVRMMAGNVHPGSSGRRQQVGSAIREQGRDAMRSAEQARSRSGKRATTGAARHTPAKQSQRQREERQRRRAGWESDAATSGEHGELQRQYEATQYAGWP